MSELRDSAAVMRNENKVLVERVMTAEGDWRTAGRSIKARKKPVSVTRAGLEEMQIRKCCGRGSENRSGDPPSLPVEKNIQGEYVGVGELWGTRRMVLMKDIKKHLGGKFDEAKNVEVVRVIKEDNGFGCNVRKMCWED